MAFPCHSSPGRDRNTGDTESARQQLETGLVDELRSLTESGKLSSMLQAIEILRSRNLSGTEFGRVVNGINVLLIKLVYPDAPGRLPAVDLPQTHNYTRIIKEAEKGNYIRPPADSDDFFEYILPFLSVNDQTSPESYSDILRDLSKAAELRPNSILPPYFQGLIHERAGRNAQAEQAFRRAYAISEECYPALAGSARIMRQSGNVSGAAAVFQDLVVRHPDSNMLKRELGITYYRANNWSRALPVVDELLLSNPRDGELLLMKAHILIEQGLYSQANAPLDIYASINPGNRNYLFYRARVQAEGSRNRDSALNYLRSILRTSPNDAEALAYAANLLMESQRSADLQEGREYLERLRRLSGTSVEVLSLSLQDAVRRENWQEAQGFLNRILAVRRTPQDLMDGYLVERGLGNNTRALNYAQELYNRDQNNNDYILIYISALIDNNRRDEASRLLENRINSVSSGSVKSRLYYLRSRIQPNEDAVLGDLRSSIFEDPRNLEALIAMFEIYHKRREERRAVYYLRQALAIAPDNPRLQRYARDYASLLNTR
ncbi:MAG: tetratricopeptide repeat protein [Treponema sp.]|nr:tetratricopeptide repeat protein [Treponema sp.]